MNVYGVLEYLMFRYKSIFTGMVVAVAFTLSFGITSVKALVWQLDPNLCSESES